LPTAINFGPFGTRKSC